MVEGSCKSLRRTSKDSTFFKYNSWICCWASFPVAEFGLKWIAGPSLICGFYWNLNNGLTMIVGPQIDHVVSVALGYLFLFSIQTMHNNIKSLKSLRMRSSSTEELIFHSSKQCFFVYICHQECLSNISFSDSLFLFVLSINFVKSYQ